MSQLDALLWLKWTLFKNSLRSAKATVTRLASVLVLFVALGGSVLFALAVAAGSYVLSLPRGMDAIIEATAEQPQFSNLSIEFIFFSVFAFSYMLWATIPLSTGSTRQFDPGNLLMYPISLKKLFAVDFVSELVTLASIFAIPSIMAAGLGAGLATGRPIRGLLASTAAAAFGVALTKFLSISIGSLSRKRRTRGESLLAIFGAVIGLGAAAAGQVVPALMRNAEFIRALRWTPPGAAAFALTTGLTGSLWWFLLALFTVIAYTAVLVFLSYWIARRAALGIGGGKRKKFERQRVADVYSGWHLPFFSNELSAVFEKELKYMLRNAQLRMMALMPLILIIIRLMNRGQFGDSDLADRSPLAAELLFYGRGFIAASGVLYIFLVLSGLICNQFSLEEGGMRAFILSPVKRWKILVAKNLAITVVALVLTLFLLLINELIFRDLTWDALIFVAGSFVIFAALMSIIGNWFSVRFPKRMRFGKTMNVSGIVGLLLLPMMGLLLLPMLGAVAAGYLSQSLAVEYATLFALVLFALILYASVISSQGEALKRREGEILEAVREPTDE